MNVNDTLARWEKSADFLELTENQEKIVACRAVFEFAIDNVELHPGDKGEILGNWARRRTATTLGNVLGAKDRASGANAAILDSAAKVLVELLWAERQEGIDPS